MTRPRYLRAAERHLATADATMADLVIRIGKCTLQSEPDLFLALMRTIVAQQLATKAARAISERVHAAFPRGLTPRAMLRASEDKLRGCGLSGGKLRAMRAVADAFVKKEVDHANIHKHTDDEVSAALLPIKGIGPWTVDMVLMFALARPDVLPVGDYGLRAAVRKLYALSELPDADTLTKIGEPWRPYRTIASWYLWRSTGPVPQS